ncbi:baseplate J/gp47 family protein [Alteromonas sp. a30]|uniref:baseplate J/gp47 family protein n=1 Tax=Alteromonas sp. a30 TaxID=2730917 RepID=UPI002280702A|nr:baseplate J/gp47 family protein [Alteromonas sp. a30]MCY7295105.1 baseplate assembly protein [Alteromonas sp. a30]
MIPNYPKPQILETVTLEQLVQARKERLLSINPNYIDVIDLDSDPIVQLFQVEAYQQLLNRQRINDVALANLLGFATGDDLDQLGDFYGLRRASGESDGGYRLRIRQENIASSTAGGAAHYRSRAIAVDPLAIRDVAVDSPEQGQVRVSVLVRDGFDIQDTVAKVREKVTAEDVRVIGHEVLVLPAEAIAVDVEADIHLLSDTPQVIFDELQNSLISAWKSAAGLGWDLSRSWLDSRLHLSGVHSVELMTPTGLTLASANQYIVPGHIQLNLAGRRE